MRLRHVHAGVFIMNLRKILKKVSVRGRCKTFLRNSRFDRLSSVLGWIYIKCSRKAVVGGVCEAFFREVLTSIACVKCFPELSFKMFAIFYGRLCRHSCKKRRQMLFGNARIKYLRTAPIQIFSQPVSCRVSAARTSVRARVDWKRQSAFMKCSRRCPRRGSHGCSHRCSSGVRVEVHADARIGRANVRIEVHVDARFGIV